MDVAHGIGLMFIGLGLSIAVLFTAYYIGSRPDKTKKYKDLSSVEKSLLDLRKGFNDKK